jgi:hypothetical protein
MCCGAYSSRQSGDGTGATSKAMLATQNGHVGLVRTRRVAHAKPGIRIRMVTTGTFRYPNDSDRYSPDRVYGSSFAVIEISALSKREIGQPALAAAAALSNDS